MLISTAAVNFILVWVIFRSFYRVYEKKKKNFITFEKNKKIAF